MTDPVFSLLCWPLGGDLWAGRLVDLDLELVRRGVRRLVSAFADELRRQADEAPEPLEEPRIEHFKVAVRPSYRTEHGVFPLAEPLDVVVDAVWGRGPWGGYRCHVPRLGLVFHFEEPSQLPLLAQHFALEALKGLTPEQLYLHRIAPRPSLAAVRAPLGRTARRRRSAPSEAHTRLAAVAEQVPAVRRAERAAGAAPVAAWERSDEVAALVELLAQPQVSVLLVGPDGVGKSTVLAEAIRRVHRGREHGSFWRTSAQRVVAGARYLGDWQQLCDRLVEDLHAARGALWLTDIAELARLGGQGPEDSVASYWTPVLERGQLRLLGELTPQELEALRGLLPGFVERFRVLTVPPMPPEAVGALLGQLGHFSESAWGVAMDPDAGRLALRLLDRFVRYEAFPGKAVRLLTDCVHHARLEGCARLEPQAVLDRFVARTGLPAILVDDRLPLERAALRAFFGARIKGQEPAVARACAVVEALKVGLNDPDKPVATLLFAGPTGVGKTALARALAAWLYGHGAARDPLVRVDMSELQHPGQIARLVGSTAGEPGELVRKLRERPFCVLLLDEIEKASPVFFDTLLGVLDEGLLTDAWGRLTDLRGALIVMTTNLGNRAGAALGFGGGDGGQAQRDSAIRAFFRPEFFNRIDHVVHFAPLGRDAARAIARRELTLLDQREGLRARGLSLAFTEELVDLLVAEGFHPDYGARALQRVVERRVVAALSRFLVERPEVADRPLVLGVAQGEVLVV
ncbi:MAG: AAA family ATPase [Pseudomonadota bacterium]